MRGRTSRVPACHWLAAIVLLILTLGAAAAQQSEVTAARVVADSELRITSFLADESLKLEVESTLYTRIEVPDGYHIYGEPLPEGFFATTVHVQEVKGLRVGEAQYPPTVPLRFEELDVTLSIYEGVVEIAVPVTATADVLNWGAERETMMLEVPVIVRYQICSEEVCYLPRTVELSMELDLAELQLPNR